MSGARRWLWGLGRLVAVLVVVLVVVLVTRDDSDRAAHRTTGTTTEAEATTVPMPAITDDPGSYAEFLFVAWENGDRAAASEVSSADAVDGLFAHPYSAERAWALDTCLPAAGSLYCTWNGTGGDQLQMVVRTLTSGLPVQVVRVEFVTS